jgi:glycosyltransferase involved in cell wall biosynthesis
MVDKEYPLSSIVMCCYNSEHYLDRSIGSVLVQTYPSIELIVVDDGSTDGSYDKARSYIPAFENKGYILKVYRQENQGPGYAAINGLKYATGAFLSFLDSDDALMPESVSKRVSAFEQTPSVNIVRTNGYKVYDATDKSKAMIVVYEKEKTTENLFDDIVIGTANNFAGTFMVRADSVKKFYKGMPVPYSDYGQNLQLILAGAYHSQQIFIDEPLMEYYIYPNTHSHKKTTEESVRMYEGWFHLRKEIVENFADDKMTSLVSARILCVKNVLSSIIGGCRNVVMFDKYYTELKSLGAVDIEWRMYNAMIHGEKTASLYYRLLFGLWRRFSYLILMNR